MARGIADKVESVKPAKHQMELSKGLVAAMVACACLPPALMAEPPLRIACVGDSITYGDRLLDHSSQSYPAVLERLGQGRFRVGNFGVNGATALAGIPFRSWTETQACREALAFQPDIAVMMLGINDLAFPELYARYPTDLQALVAMFQTLPTPPRIFLCTLTPIAPAEEQTQANETIRETMIPAIRKVAAETGARIVDIAAVYPSRLEWLPDGLHPTPAGAELIAQTVLTALDAPTASAPRIQPAPLAGPVDISIRNEAHAAQTRAQQWLETQPAPAELQTPVAREDFTPLLPLLSGVAAGTNANLFFEYATLAASLVRAGQETVFLPDGSPVSWREALLHRLVQRQRIDARGGGFWSDPRDGEDAANAIRSTTYALQAIAAVLSPAGSGIQN